MSLEAPGDVRKTWSVPEEVTGSMSRIIEESVDVKATKGYSESWRRNMGVGCREEVFETADSFSF